VGAGANYLIAPAVSRPVGVAAGVTPTNADRGRITNPLSQVTEYEQDAQGRVLKQINPGGETLTWGRGILGRVTLATDGNGWGTTYSHDSFGQLTSKVVPDGLSASLSPFPKCLPF
jgi:YD repeat-containing protein